MTAAHFESHGLLPRATEGPNPNAQLAQLYFSTLTTDANHVIDPVPQNTAQMAVAKHARR